MRYIKKIAIFVAISCFATIIMANTTALKKDDGILFQVALINSLAQGVYDGDITYEELSRHGNFGLGTFNHLNGEMVAVDGKFYQITSEGKLREVQASELTPFSEVTFFKPKEEYSIQNLKTFNALTTTLLKYFKNKNIPYAFRIDGNFCNIKFRSIPMQHKPYPNLATAATLQHIFNRKTIQGTIVGYYFPNYFSNIAVPGFHLHFVSTNRTIGGHVLELAITQAKISVQPLYKVEIVLSHTLDFATANLENKKIENSVIKAEKNPDALRQGIK